MTELAAFMDRCLCLDLETGPDGTILALGAAFGEETVLQKHRASVREALDKVHEMAGRARFLLGHNLLGHDLPMIEARFPQSPLLRMPVVDTLYLSPLAFPENPYHRLVKDYKLVRDSLNDPLADARLAASLFADQWEALTGCEARESGRLSFYRYAFSGSGGYRGIQQALKAMGAASVEGSEAVEIFEGLSRGRVCMKALKETVPGSLEDPEQLRNRSFRDAVRYREIGCWVFDEAHCLSKWGHDFRPDYLYAARFIKEFSTANQGFLPPVQCFSATAKEDVLSEIIAHFRTHLGVDLEVFKGAEAAAESLQTQGWQAEAFHAGIDPARKRDIQADFVDGRVRVICATNAFGMGIDKEDVRLVAHMDIPGSLENYVQEAGRAGRDRLDAECVLFYEEEDIETQFRLSALSRLDRGEIARILRVLRRARRDREGNVVLTTGELVRDEEMGGVLDPDERGSHTKVVTAVSWLERAGFLDRGHEQSNPEILRNLLAVLGPQDLHLGYPARFPADHPIHGALSALHHGSRLEPLVRNGHVILTDGAIPVARLSRAAAEEWRDRLDRISSIRVAAVIRRFRDDGDAAYRGTCRVDAWDIPLVEIHLERDAPAC